MHDDSMMTSGKRNDYPKTFENNTMEKGQRWESSTSAESEAVKHYIKLHKRFEREENRLSGADTFLARMYHSIAYTRGIDGSSKGMLRWRNILNQYIAKLDRWYRRWKMRNVKEKEGDDSRYVTPNKNSVRGNLQKQLLSKRMSWYIFIRALRLLQVPRIDITMRVYSLDGSSIVHEETIMFDDAAIEEHILNNDFDLDLDDDDETEKDGGDVHHEE